MDYLGRPQVNALPVKLGDGVSTAKAARKWLRKVRRPAAAAAAASPSGISVTPTTTKAAANEVARKDPGRGGLTHWHPNDANDDEGRGQVARKDPKFCLEFCLCDH